MDGPAKEGRREGRHIFEQGRKRWSRLLDFPIAATNAATSLHASRTTERGHARKYFPAPPIRCGARVYWFLAGTNFAVPAPICGPRFFLAHTIRCPSRCTGVDWPGVLPTVLRRALADRTADDFYLTLSWMVARLEDGHGYVWGREPRGGLAIRVEVIGERLVVTAAEGDTRLQKGDVIERVDDVEAHALLEQREQYVSGSPQLRRYRALNEYAEGPLGSVARLEIERAGGGLLVGCESHAAGVGTRSVPATARSATRRAGASIGAGPDWLTPPHDPGLSGTVVPAQGAP